jgi:dTDP-4-dehydrorhamnose reductase
MPAERRRILLFGGSGQVGTELRRTLEPLGDVIAPPRADADFERPVTLLPLVAASRPALIVNAAAYTAVEDAEDDEARCHAVNADAPGVLARAAAEHGAVFVHYSTDYVFDGTKGEPYVEEDAPSPLNAYGWTKLAGEQAVAAAGGESIVLRTSWVYAAHGRNFVRTIARAARERAELRVVDDQHGAPTWARDIADATAQLCATALGRRHATEWGVYHLTAAGSTTWYGFARAIVEELSRYDDTQLARVVPVTSAEFPQRARRAANSRLCCARLRRTFGLELRDWHQSLRDMLATSAARANLLGSVAA